MSERVYTLAICPPELRSMVAKDVGHRLWFSGIILQGEGHTILCMLQSGVDFNKLEATILKPPLATWGEILASADDPSFYDEQTKAWIRKSQRQVSNHIQQKIWARDNFRCVYCDRKMGDVRLTVDHFVPLEKGGANDPTNYVTACARCNKDKGSIPPQEFCQQNGYYYETIRDRLASFGPTGLRDH